MCQFIEKLIPLVCICGKYSYYAFTGVYMWQVFLLCVYWCVYVASIFYYAFTGVYMWQLFLLSNYAFTKALTYRCVLVSCLLFVLLILCALNNTSVSGNLCAPPITN